MLGVLRVSVTGTGYRGNEYSGLSCDTRCHLNSSGMIGLSVFMAEAGGKTEN